MSLSRAYVIWFYFQDIIISQESDWLDSERKEYAAEYTQLWPEMDLDRPNSIAMRTDKSSFGTATASVVTESGGTWSSLLDFTEEEYMHSKARATDWCEYAHQSTAFPY